MEIRAKTKEECVNTYNRIGDFHKTRATGVGSSDIATLAGYTQHYGRTTRMLWEEKTGRAEPFHGNRFTHWGNLLEGLVLREWISRRYGRDLADKFYRAYLRNRDHRQFKVKTEARHPEYPFALSHVDLLVHGELPLTCPHCGSSDLYAAGITIECSNGCGKEITVPDGWITEAKSHSFFGALRSDDLDAGYDPKDRSQNGIPAGEFLQIQWQEFCYDLPSATLSTLIDTSDYREYGPVKADPRVQEKCLALAERFWWHVEKDTPPKPENWDDIASLWPRPQEKVSMYGLDTVLTERVFLDRDGNEVTVEGTLLDMLTEREKLAAGQKKAKKRLEEIKVAAGILMGENRYLVASDGTPLVTRVQTERDDVATAKVRDESPELWQQLKDGGFVTQSTTDYPRFRKVKR